MPARSSERQRLWMGKVGKVRRASFLAEMRRFAGRGDKGVVQNEAACIIAGAAEAQAALQTVSVRTTL